MWKVFIFVLFISQCCIGGFERTTPGARATAFSNAYAGLANDVWSIYSNPAGLSYLKSYQASFYYSPQPFGLSELAEVAFAGTIPFRFGSLGIGVRKYGFDLYRELSATLSYANQVLDVFLGINLNYHTVTIRNYGSASTVGIDMGMLVPISQNFQWGACIKNINSPTIGVSKEKLPQSFTTGVAYFPMENLSLLMDVDKEIGFDLNGRFGFEYWIINSVAIRGGVSDTPTQFSGGVGVRYSIFQVDYGFATHQELGWTHSFSITIQ